MGVGWASALGAPRTFPGALPLGIAMKKAGPLGAGLFANGCGGEERSRRGEQVRWTCESDERRELVRAADLNL